MAGRNATCACGFWCWTGAEEKGRIISMIILHDYLLLYAVC